MIGEDRISMSQREIKRAHIIRRVTDRLITQVEASEILGLCVRQVKRLVKRFRADGERGIIHRSRGKKSNHSIPEGVRGRALKLFQDKYPDFGPTFASEKLKELDKIVINDETLRLWLNASHIPYKRRKKRPHRQWRERKEHYGQMVQMDGSKHDWFEGRGPECVLMGYIDDATGKPFGRFYQYEGTIPAMDSFRKYIRKYGLPLSVYLDRHSTYKSNAEPSIEDQLNDRKPLSQFERALGELGVEVIHAYSPQAKGRIERLFRTFQDRLIKEMRLRKIRTIEEANKFLEWYLPVYGKQFGVEPTSVGDFHRPVPKPWVLDKTFCIKTERTLRNDFTVLNEGKFYQILNRIRAKKVFVIERLNGSMAIMYKGRLLKFKPIAAKPQKQEKTLRVKRFHRFKPAAKNNPWRMFTARNVSWWKTQDQHSTKIIQPLKT